MVRGGEFCSPDYFHYILPNQDLQKSPPQDETDSERGRQGAAGDYAQNNCPADSEMLASFKRVMLFARPSSTDIMASSCSIEIT
jgi:hypothetical protein